MAYVSSRILQMGSTLFILAQLFAVVAALVQPQGDTSQHPLLSTPTAIGNFSVGFSLQSSYGAAAIIYEDENGELQTRVRVSYGTKAYRAVMARLSLECSKHLAPPYGTMGEYFQDQPRRAVRNGLKKLGLPASADVGVLADVIQILQHEMEAENGIRISEAVFTSTHLVALYSDDLWDLADYVGIKYVTPKSQFRPMLWETAASYAGYGLGLCEHWQDEDRCDQEKAALPDINLLSVHYSQNALTAGMAPIQTAVSANDYFHVENFTLGSDAISSYSSPEDYWADVKDTLLYVMRDFSPTHWHVPDKVMLTGDMTHDEDFMRVLKEAVKEYMGDVPPILSEEARTAAAKGAAELMRRGPAPWSGLPPR